MPVRKRALDRQRLAGPDQRLPAQHAPDRVDRLRRQMRQVGQRLLAHAVAVAVAAPDQRGLVLAALVTPPARDHMDHRRLPRHHESIAGTADGNTHTTRDYLQPAKSAANPPTTRARDLTTQKSSV